MTNYQASVPGDDHYPSGIDVIWLCTDRNGCIAACCTGGTGPIPTKLLTKDPAGLVGLEEKILSLPTFTTLSDVRPATEYISFKEFIQRGIFPFDWSDVHRSKESEIGEYSLMASPTTALTTDAIDGDLASCASAVVFGGIDFQEIDSLRFWDFGCF